MALEDRLMGGQAEVPQEVAPSPSASGGADSPVPDDDDVMSPNTRSRRPSIIIETEEARETFGKRVEFLLTTVGYAVGVGNVWRFPYLCYNNGGGSFLIPYLFALIFLGAPVFLLELAIGQLFRRGSYHSIYIMEPRLRSLGIISVYLSAMVALYYNVVIGWSVFYFVNCFRATLPWSSSDEQDLVVKSQQFWDEQTTDRSGGFYQVTRFNWPLVGCLFFSWLVIYVCIRKGIKSSGKVVYVTATAPYILLVVLFFRGVTLTGAGEGIRYYLTPDMSKLANPRVWTAAANQIFYSLGTGFGSLIAYGSYNPRNENVVQDAILVPAINSFTSIFAGFGIFSILGHLAHETGVEVPDVASASTGLAFVAYPAGLSLLPAPQFFSMCFFAMLFCLGVDSEFAMVEVGMTFVKDMKIPIPQERLAALLCCTGFFVGLVFTTDAGLYWFEWLDFWCSAFALMGVVLVECITVGYLYGSKRFTDEFRRKCKRVIQPYWWVCIKYICPTCFTVLLGFAFVTACIEGHDPGKGVSEPPFATFLGWVVAIIPALIGVYCWFTPPVAKREETDTDKELAAIALPSE
eukprot:Sspe_Gene.19395::Locus_7068_Transcript_1_1_Confidence_1.000_Length_1873::g.19395::m.19395